MQGLYTTGHEEPCGLPCRRQIQAHLGEHRTSQCQHGFGDARGFDGHDRLEGEELGVRRAAGLGDEIVHRIQLGPQGQGSFQPPMSGRGRFRRQGADEKIRLEAGGRQRVRRSWWLRSRRSRLRVALVGLHGAHGTLAHDPARAGGRDTRDDADRDQQTCDAGQVLHPGRREGGMHGDVERHEEPE